MLQIIIFKTTIEPENRKEDGGSEINDEVGGNDNRSLCELVEIRKNTSSKKRFFIAKTRLSFTQLR